MDGARPSSHRGCEEGDVVLAVHVDEEHRLLRVLVHDQAAALRLGCRVEVHGRVAVGGDVVLARGRA